MKKAFLFLYVCVCTFFYNTSAYGQGSPSFDNCPDASASAGTLQFPDPLEICSDGSGFQLSVPSDATYDTYEFIFENPNDLVPPGLLPGTPGGPRIYSLSSNGTFNPADYGMVDGDVICGIGFNYNIADLQAFIDGFTPGTLCCNLLGGFNINCAEFPDGSTVTSLGDLFTAFSLDTIDLPDVHAALGLLGSLGCPAAPCYISSESVCMTVTTCEPAGPSGSPAFDNCPDASASAGTLQFPNPLEICSDGSGFQLSVPSDATYDTYEFIFENPNDLVPPGLLPGTPGGPRIYSLSSNGTFNPADYGMVDGDVICGIGFNYNIADLQAFIDGFTPGTLCCNLLGGFNINCAEFPDGSAVTSLGDLFTAFSLDTIDLPDVHAALGLLGSLGCPAAPCYISSESVCMTVTTCEPVCAASYGTVSYGGDAMLCEGGSTAPVCLDGNNTAADYTSAIVLTAGPDLTILGMYEVCNNISLTGLLPGDYTLHAFNVLSADLALLNGVSTGTQVADLIAAGTVCAALDVTGIPITILSASDPLCIGPQPPQTEVAVIELPAGTTTHSFSLLTYSSDPNGDVLAFDVSQPDQGATLTFDAASGMVELTIDPTFSGTITISYAVSDGTFVTNGSVLVNVIGSTVDVTLLRLKGKAMVQGNLIEWTTASETNSYKFDLYRTQDVTNEYQHIATINGAGNSSSLKNYAYTDKSAPTGMTYYRLTQTDFDGSLRELGVVAVQRSSNIPTVSVVPNPVSTTAHIEFVLPQGGDATIQLHDISGKLVTSKNTMLQDGLNSISLEMATYPAGIYFVTISHEDCVLMTKLLKQ